MSESAPEQRPKPMDYAAPVEPRFRFLKFVGGMFLIWAIMFVPAFLAGASAFERPLPGWAIPVTGVVALACAFIAWSARRKPYLSQGMWTGLAIGLLHAGWCFIAV